MQEQKASKPATFVARFGLANIIWSSVCAALLLAAALVWLLPYASLPTATGRTADDTLPWEAPTLRVEKVSGCWMRSEGNARMQLRAAFYPEAVIELGDATGSGRLYVRFTDSNGHQSGDTITLSYKDGAFLPRREVNISAEGRAARVFVEAGFETENEFRLHEVSESEQLWRVNLSCLPQGESDIRPLGSITIPAEAE